MMHILQTQLPDLQALSKVSLEISEAASNLGALKIIFGIFMAITMLIILVFIGQSLAITKRIRDMAYSLELVSKYFNHLSDKDIGKEEAITMVKEVINHNTSYIKYSILRIRLENNIIDTSTTETKVKLIIRNMYSEMNGYLVKFAYNEKTINDIIAIEQVSKEEKERLFNIIWEQVYAEKFNTSSMDQSINLFMQEIKLNYISKIESL